MKLALGIVGLVICILGFMLCTFALFFVAIGVTDDSDKPIARGVVVDRTTHYRRGSNDDIYVRYQVGDASYVCKSDELPVTSDNIGDHVDIEYDIADPTNCEPKASKWDNVVYVAFGMLVSAIFGGVILYKMVKR